MTDPITSHSRFGRTASLKTLAVALLAMPAAVQGQAYNGTPVVTQGTANIDRTNLGQDIFTLNTDRVTIDWTPFDAGVGGGEIDFLPAGFQVIYRNDPALVGDFAVLNRILPNDPSRAIALNGNVISQLQGAAGTTTGGTVWFYSPGGVIVGSTATIDVGNLLLSSLDPSVAPVPGNESFFGSPAVSGTAVDIRNGATINALTEGSYVAAIAPVITQAGTVQVNGGVAYVAAEQASLTFRTNGLFDIRVQTGSDGIAGVPLRHLGSTTGPISGGVGDNHRIYLVTLPKNDAITMMIGAGSNLGFDIAGAADLDGNAIILSPGDDIFNGDNNRDVITGPDRNIAIVDSNITSRLDAAGAHNISVTSNIADMRFASDVFFASEQSVDISVVGAGNQLSFDDELLIFSRKQAVTNGEGDQGGNVSFRAIDAGNLSINGQVDIFAQAFGRGDAAGTGGDGFGGNLLVRATNGGAIQFARALNFDGRAGGGFGATGGTGLGGRADIEAIGGNSSIDFTGDVTIDNSGRAGRTDTDGANGTDGRGGNINILLEGGAGNTITMNGSTQFRSQGEGGLGGLGGKSGSGFGGNFNMAIRDNSSLTASQFNFLVRGLGARTDFSPGIDGSDVFGGNANITIEGSGSNFSADSFVFAADTFAFESNDANAGNGTGGDIQINANNGGIINLGSGASGQKLFSVDGRGGDAAGAGFASGEGFGGSIRMAINGGTISFGESPRISASGQGGNGTGANSGIGRGGLIEIIANGTGSLLNSTDQFDLQASGSGGSQRAAVGSGHDGIAGTARIQILDGAAARFEDLRINVIGSGGASAGATQTGGAGFGGSAEIIVDNATLNVAGNADVNASAFGRSGSLSAGGNGTGGNILFEVRGNSAVNLADLDLDSSARGANVFNGDSVANGEGQGGTVTMRAVDAGSNINLTGTLDLDANGSGTTGGSQGGGNIDGSDSFGGTAILEVVNGTIGVDGGVNVAAGGFAGSAVGTGQGGEGFGGTARIALIGNGTFNFGNQVDVTARGAGGGSNGAGGISGDGSGGRAEVIVSGGTMNVASTIRADANGNGGGGENGGTSGTATGGTALVSIMNGTLNADFVAAQADGNGGFAQNALSDSGDGIGGNADILVLSGGTIDARALSASAIGRGLSGMTGADGISGEDGGSGGDGSGGTARILIDAGSGILRADSVFLDASGIGGRAGDGGMGTGGTGGRGGNGGSGIGGTAIFGTASSASTGTNSGVIDIVRNAAIRALGTGGTGGDGGTGTIQGDGGNGGTAGGGMAQYVQRGGAVTADGMTMDGLGGLGEGGLGATRGLDGTRNGNSGLIDVGANIGTGDSGTFSIGFLTFNGNNGSDFGQNLDIIVSGGSTMNAVQMSLNDRDSGIANQRFSVLVDNATLNFNALRAEIAGDIGIDLVNGGTMSVDSFSLLTNNGGGSISLNGDGILNLPFSVFIESEQDFVSNLVLNTSSTVDVAVGGAAVFNNDVMGRVLRITAGDIVLGDGIIFGDVNTQRIDLRSTNVAGTILGGDGNGTGFVLDNEEVSLFSAQNIFFTVDNSGLEIRDLNLRGFDAGANANLTLGTSEFAITANGLIRVDGNVRFTDMADGNILSLESAPGSGIEIAADTGGIILDGNSPGGILTLSGDFIHVAEAGLLDQLAMDPSFAGRDDALATGLAVAKPAGTISARSLNLNVAERLLIQNSGTVSDLSGFNVLTGELTINNISAMSNDLDLVIFGRFENPDGTFITNENVRDALFDPAQPGGFLAEASVNGCLLSANACDPIASPAPTPTPTPTPTPDPSPDPDPIGDDPPVIAPDIRDRVENEAQGERSDPAEEEMIEETEEESVTSDEEQEAIEAATSRSPIVRPVTIVDTRPLDSDVVIEEAVTGGGNPGLISRPDKGGDGGLRR